MIYDWDTVPKPILNDNDKQIGIGTATESEISAWAMPPVRSQTFLIGVFN